MKQTQTLSEFIEFAQSASKNGQLFISQQENYPSGVSLGDEDMGGIGVEMHVDMLLAAPEKAIHFEKTYNDLNEYEETIMQIKAIEQSLPSQRINSSDMEKVIQKHSQ
ncbi:hypothetical protein QYG89_03595 [Bacillus sp. B190/17]|uniref:Uncharacterized protein n=1 Tax=Bacillus lumedeiriae TaxID=3058829 RepID=A0ABW8I7T0_9BACI